MLRAGGMHGASSEAIVEPKQDGATVFSCVSEAAVVTDIDSTVKEIGRKLLKAIGVAGHCQIRCSLEREVCLSAFALRFRMPSAWQDKSVPWQLRVRRSQALQRLGEIFEEETLALKFCKKVVCLALQTSFRRVRWLWKLAALRRP